MSVKFLVLGGILGLGGGECRFYFYGRADFSELQTSSVRSPRKTNFRGEGTFRPTTLRVEGPPLRKVSWFGFHSGIATRTAIYRSRRALRARNPQKVSPGLLARSVQTFSKKVEMSQKKLFRDFSETFLRLFDSFRAFLDTLGREGWGDLFETFWGFWARRARRLL